MQLKVPLVKKLVPPVSVLSSLPVVFVSFVSCHWRATSSRRAKIMRVGHPDSRAGLATVRGWNRVGAEEDMFKPTPPHNLGMPSCSGDQEHIIIILFVIIIVIFLRYKMIFYIDPHYTLDLTNYFSLKLL